MTVRIANDALLALIVLICGYIAVAPFVPAITYKFQNHKAKQAQLEKVIHSRAAGSSTPGSSSTLAAGVNQVVIPSMGLDTPLYQGSVANQYKILDKGIWVYAKGSTPDKGGNTVLIGHRFTYTNPRGIFYYLNKVNVGDEIGVLWSNKEYTYKVTSVKVVNPSDTAVENPSQNSELTLFTCTPLLSPTHRLVVVADLETN